MVALNAEMGINQRCVPSVPSMLINFFGISLFFYQFINLLISWYIHWNTFLFKFLVAGSHELQRIVGVLLNVLSSHRLFLFYIFVDLLHFMSMYYGLNKEAHTCITLNETMETFFHIYSISAFGVIQYVDTKQKIAK